MRPRSMRSAPPPPPPLDQEWVAEQALGTLALWFNRYVDMVEHQVRIEVVNDGGSDISVRVAPIAGGLPDITKERRYRLSVIAEEIS